MKQVHEAVEKVSEISALQKFSNDVLEIWRNKDHIRNVFAPDLTDLEFKYFMGLGVAMKANPFAREIWAVKYDKNKPAQTFLGRDFYRKKAQEQADYNGHQTWAVFEKDIFEYDLRHPSGLPLHKFDVTKDRGELRGAYCFAYKKGIDRPFVVYVSIEEAIKLKANGAPQSTWASQPITQMEKVPEARCLRMVWQGVFRGTYAEDEEPIIKQSEYEKKLKSELKEKQAEAKEVVNGEIQMEDFNNLNEATVKLKTRLEKCITNKGGGPDQGKIIDALMKFSEDSSGESVIDYEKMTTGRAKSTLLRFEIDRFQHQLEGYMVADQIPGYIKEITAYEDCEGIDDLTKFKGVKHLYMAKSKFKADIKGGILKPLQKDLFKEEK